MAKLKLSNLMLVVMHQPHIKNRMHSCAFYCSDVIMRGSRTSKLEHCKWHSFHLSTTCEQTSSNFSTSSAGLQYFSIEL